MRTRITGALGGWGLAPSVAAGTAVCQYRRAAVTSPISTRRLDPAPTLTPTAVASTGCGVCVGVSVLVPPVSSPGVEVPELVCVGSGVDAITPVVLVPVASSSCVEVLEAVDVGSWFGV